MAELSFDQFYAGIKQRVPDAKLEGIRDEYEKRFNQPAYFRNGPRLSEFRQGILQRVPDASLDDIDAEYERRYNTLPWYQDAYQGFKAGLGNLATFGGGGIHALGFEDAGQAVMDYGKGIQARNAPEAGIASMALEDMPEMMTRGDWWAYNVPNVLTSFAPSLAAGAAMAPVAGPVAGAVVGGLLGGAQEGFGGTYPQLLEEGMSREEAIPKSLAMTGGSAALNAFPLARILRRASGGLGARALTGLAEGVTELAEEPLEAVITGEDPLEATRQGFGVLPLAALTGGLLQGGKAPPTQAQEDEYTRTLEDVRIPDRSQQIRPSALPEDVPRGTPAPELAEGEYRTTTSAGSEVNVRPIPVSLDDIITSDSELYPDEFQPRDRTRGSSDIQVNKIARNLDGNRLLPSPEAATGAPLVMRVDTEKGPKYVVISGNARTMAVRRAYRDIPDRAEAYRNTLSEKGFELQPGQVLVGQITSPFNPTQFAVEANQADTLTMSAAETAQADAQNIDASVLSLYDGGDIDLAKNTRFVQAFLAKIPATQRNDLVDERGRVSQAGVRRIQGALLARAYGTDRGALPGLSRMLESTDDNTRAITGGLIDAAPAFAELRTRIQDGRVAPEYDIAADLAAAAQLVSDARTGRRSITEVLAQLDAFDTRSELTEAATRLFGSARGRAAVAERLTRYAQQALRAGDLKQVGMFDGQRASPAELLAGNQQPRRTPQPASRGLRAEGVRKAIAPIAGKWRSGPKIQVIEDYNELPEYLRRNHELRFGRDAAGAVNGYRVGDQIWLIGRNIYSPAEAVRILAHEAVGHFGIERMLGPEEWRKTQQRVLNLIGKDADISAIAADLRERYADDQGNPPSDQVLSSEIVASMAERGITHPLLDRILARIREWLRSQGFNVKFTKKDLQALLARAAKELEKPNATVGVGSQASIRRGDDRTVDMFAEPAAEDRSAWQGIGGAGEFGVYQRGPNDYVVTQGGRDGEILPSRQPGGHYRQRAEALSAARELYQEKPTRAPQPKGPKLTKIQEHALGQALELGSTFTTEELMARPSTGSGKVGTAGQAVTEGGTINVNTVTGLAQKGYLQDLTPDKPFFEKEWRVAGQASISRARTLARDLHEEQVDYDGKPYVPHVMRVGDAGRSENEQLAGYLHDIVEDTPTTLAELQEMGFPAEVIEAVDTLTWREEQGESYDDYLTRVMQNPLAQAVKFYDARDNMRLRVKDTPESQMMAWRTYGTMLKMWEQMDGQKPPLAELEALRPTVPLPAQPSMRRVNTGPIGRNRTIDVLQNPNRKELQRFASTVEDDVRYWRDADGNLFVWDADDMLHADMVSALGYPQGYYGSTQDFFSNNMVEARVARQGKLFDTQVMEDVFDAPSEKALAMNAKHREFLERMQGQASMTRRRNVDPYLALVHRNLGRISRTYAGVTDAAGSATKAQNFEVTGEEAGRRSRANVTKAWEFATTAENQYVETPEQILELMNNMAGLVTGGVVREGKMFREHDAAEEDGSPRYIPFGDVQAELKKFSEELFEIKDTAHHADLAAFIHRRFNHEIHPYTDGVTKMTELLTGWALYRRGDPLPVMPEDRDEFFANVTRTKGDMGAWMDYFRPLVPTRVQHHNTLGRRRGEIQEWLAKLGPELRADYERLFQTPYFVNDIPIEFMELYGEAARHQLAFAEQILNGDQQAILAEYNALKDVEDTKGGQVLNVDAVRELYQPYRENRGAWSRATHEVSSAWVKDQFRIRVNEPGQHTILVTAGGSGAGKSTALNRDDVDTDGYHLILDAVMGNEDSAQDKITQALAANNKVDYLFISRDIPEAWGGVIYRAIDKGRTVPLDVHLKNHFGARMVLHNISNYFNFSDAVSIKVFRVNADRTGQWVNNRFDLPDHAPNNVYMQAGLDMLRQVVRDGGIIDDKGQFREISADTARGLLPTPKSIDEETGPIVREINELAGLSANAEVNAGADQQGQASIRPRLESGGGSYAPTQFAGLNTQEYELLKRLSSMNEELTAKQRGGLEPVTWDQTERDALEAIVKDPSKVVEALATRGIGSTANARELEAYGQILNQAVRDTQAMAARAAQTRSEEDLVAFMGYFEKLSLLQAPYAGYMTEAGRALNILRKAKDASLAAVDILDMLPPGLAAALPGGPTATNRDVVLNLADQIARAEEPGEVTGNARKAHKAGIFDKVYEYWVNSILSGLNTHAVNNISNAAFQLLENVSSTVGSALPGGIPLDAAMRRWTGGLHGLRLGAKLFGRAFMTGEPQMGTNQKIEARFRNAIPGVLGEIIRIPGRALLAEDEFWKAISYYAEASEKAAVKAKREGLEFADIMANLEEHPDIHEAAVREAARLTFTTDMGPAMKAINRALIKSRLGKFIAPFIRTPSNILKEAIRYTPGAGLAIQQVRDDIQGKNGPEARAVQYGRWIVGTGMYTTVGLMTAAGLMTGAGPDDPRERRLLQRTGWQPYSVKFGDKWIRYNRFEPVGMILGLGADMVEIGQYAQGGELDKIHAMVMGSLMNNLASKTFLSGVFDFAEAMSDPQRYLPRWAARMAQSFVVPNAIGQAVWTSDPLVREARTIADRIRSRIPGKRQELNALLDVAGEPIEQTATTYGLPFNVSEEKSDPVAEAMLRLGIFKGKPGRTLMNVKLEDDVYNEYAKLMGKTRWQHLTPLVNSPQFRALMLSQPEVARQILEKVWDDIGRQVRTAFLYRNPEILVKSRQERAKPRAIGSNYL